MLGRLILLVALFCLIAAWAIAASGHSPATPTGDDNDYDWLDIMGYACIAVAFVAIVVISIVDRRPLSLAELRKLPPPRHRKRNRDLRRRHA